MVAKVSVFAAAFVLSLMFTWALFASATHGAAGLGSGQAIAVGLSADDGSGRRYSKSNFDITPLSDEAVEELAADLTDEERRVLLNDGTEPAFCGTLLDNKLDGFYACKLCALPLFESDRKFDSGTGWPSFDRAFDVDHVTYKEDRSYGMVRTEIECARCDGHLGHVFADGPTSTGRRYCLNSASLDFIEKGTEIPLGAQPVKTETAYLAGGCFWGVEHYFQKQSGVIDVVSGYQGGHVDNPTYKQVCTGKTGHTESVRITYDPAEISFRELLEIFFVVHDPRQLNRQGPDIGTQYRSAIFAIDDEQLRTAREFIEEAASDPKFKGRPIVTEVNEYATFYEAEDYHQDYNARTGRQCFLPTFAD
ncbi:MAG: bifunctional methionine sulfoxide reductase B/A protein [Planctomycetota bacterium]